MLLSNARLKLAKKPQANAKQHPESELLVLWNYAHSSSTSLTRIIGHFKNKHKCVCIHEQVCLYSWGVFKCVCIQQKKCVCIHMINDNETWRWKWKRKDHVDTT